MLRHAEEDEVEQMKFTARLHGLDLDEQPEDEISIQGADDIHETPREEERPTRVNMMGAQKILPYAFQSPKAYSHLSQEEKEELTQKMMRAHKTFIRQEGILQPKKPRL